MLKQELILKLIRFGIVGALAAVLQYALVRFCSTKLGWGNSVSYWTGYFPALTLHFCLTKWWTFRNNQRKELGSQLGRYLVATGISMGFQYLVFRVAVKYVTPVVANATMIGTAAGMALSFVMMKWGVFEVKEKVVAPELSAR